MFSLSSARLHRPSLPVVRRRRIRTLGTLLALLALFALSVDAAGRQIDAGPDDYLAKLAALQPGDTLRLAPGEYRRGLPLHGMSGAPQSPIVIRGPVQGEPAILVARPGANTVSIKDAAYVHVRDLRLDGRGIPVDAVKLEGTARYGHHITLENLHIVGHGANQQIVAISTKAPAWGWVVRGNRIHGAGTGMYFGNSDGTGAFFDGLIEHNLVTAPLGYAIQIKHQAPRPVLDNAPRGRHVTIIRHNVLSKAEGGSSGPAARPNLLLGHWPRAGDGTTDEYQVYGNFFDENPHEALFQAEGNVAFYSNVLRNRLGPGIAIQPHNDVPREVRVFHNTILTGGEPIIVRSNEHTPTERQFLRANAVFSAHPIRGGVQSDNVLATLDEASIMLSAYAEPFNPFPRTDGLRCPSPEAAWIKGLADARCDFNGQPRELGYCGAYAGHGPNPGWLPVLGVKPRVECRAR